MNRVLIKKDDIWVCVAWSPCYDLMEAIFNRRRKAGERVKLLINAGK